MIALIGMAIATVAIFGFSIWRSSRARIDVPVATLPAAPVPAEERTLTYWITVQKFRNGKPFKSFTVPGEMIFEDDYRIQISVRSPQPGYLYIFSEGPPEGTAPIEFVLLFPSLTANKGSSLLASDQVVQIPKNLVSIRQRGRH